MDDLLKPLQIAKTEGLVSIDTYNNLLSWLQNDELNEFQGEIAQLIKQEDWQALNDAFYTQIEFGTAGIRGKTGLGSARINSWTVGSAAQGLANYVASFGDAAKQRGVVIGSDTRLTSPEFVALVSDVMTSNGIRVFRFERPPQVGMFSFAVRLKKAQAGIYISASHNPPTDNGLKIYWEDGCQALPPHDKAITDAVKQVTMVNKEQPDNSLITLINDDFDTAYRTRVLRESVYESRSAHIVYSPFHGTGIYGVLPVLVEAGFSVTTVDEQMKPDGNFPNVPGGVPNPQNRESNQLTAEKVLASGADLGISTDPDADRLGLVIPKDGSTVILDGNQTASLLAYFITQLLKNNELLPKNGFLVRTVVTTAIIDAIAQDFGLRCYNNLPVGFRYIGDCIRTHEDFGDELFVFGAEESFGCLKGSYARDKDASSAALIAAEMVSWLKDNGKTAWDLFDEMRERYGYYHNDLIDLKYEGAEGFGIMTKLMDSLRADPPQQIGELLVISTIDRRVNKKTVLATGAVEDVTGHTTNMLIYELSEDGKTTVIIRPSGTEAKIKLYVAIWDKTGNIEAAKAQAESIKTALIALAAARSA